MSELFEHSLLPLVLVLNTLKLLGAVYLRNTKSYQSNLDPESACIKHSRMFTVKCAEAQVPMQAICGQKLEEVLRAPQ